jgi:hypothetical protein
MYKQPTLEIIRTNIIKRANLQAGGRKQRQRAASAPNALLGQAPHLAGVVLIKPMVE